MSKSISDELDEIYQQNGYNLSQIVGEDMSVVSFDLRDFLKAKQAILALFNKHVEELLPEPPNEAQVHTYGGSFQTWENGYNQALNDIRAKLKE